MGKLVRASTEAEGTSKSVLNHFSIPLCLGKSFTPASVSLLSTLKHFDAGHGKFVG